MSRAWLAWALGLALLGVLAFHCITSITQSKTTVETEVHAAQPTPGWMFLHMQKAGGTTVNTILKDRWKTKTTVYNTVNWKKGDDTTRAYVDQFVTEKKWDVIRGASVEALRRFSDETDNWKWFTIFRHPVSRLVSAFFFCRKRPVDKLCASEILRSEDTDLIGFARHWGNYGLRQFAFGLVPADDVISAFSNGTLSLPGNVSWTTVSDWYLLKVYLDYTKRFKPNGKPDAALYDMLGPIQDTLRDHYAVVGILEEWNTTMDLFNVGLSMPDLDWHKAYQRSGLVNADNMYASEESAALEMAMMSSEIKSFISLDILLYEHALDIFNHQARTFGTL